MTSTDDPGNARGPKAKPRVSDEHIGRMLASETLREGSFDHDLLADLRDARAERDELRQRIVSEIEGWYRAAFAEFERAVAAEQASDDLGRAAAVANRRRAFTVMDTWCQAWSAAGSVPVATSVELADEWGAPCSCIGDDLGNHDPACEEGQRSIPNTEPAATATRS